MDLTIVLALLALACVAWGVSAAIRIGADLERRGIKVNWFLMRLSLIGWVSRYRKLTIAEQGRPGPLYGQFVLAMNGALVLAVLAILARWRV